jgi:hypothetical protein
LHRLWPFQIIIVWETLLITNKGKCLFGLLITINLFFVQVNCTLRATFTNSGEIRSRTSICINFYLVKGKETSLNFLIKRRTKSSVTTEEETEAIKSIHTASDKITYCFKSYCKTYWQFIVKKNVTIKIMSALITYL